MDFARITITKYNQDTMNVKFNFMTLVLALVLIAGCQKESIATNESELETGIGWLEPEINNTVGKVYILSEGYGATSPVSGYRVQANVKKLDGSGDNHPITSLDIGNVNVPAVTSEESTGNSVGIVHKLISPGFTPELWADFQSQVDNEIELLINDATGIIERQSIKIAPPLNSSVSQEGVDFVDMTSLDLSKPLKISWPVDRVETRSATNYEHKVGASILYSPRESRRQFPERAASYPNQSIHKEFVVPFDLGEITFTEADLAAFPHHSMVTIYIGQVRYKIDHNGDIVHAPGGTTVISGGVSGTPFIRTNEP